MDTFFASSWFNLFTKKCKRVGTYYDWSANIAEFDKAVGYLSLRLRLVAAALLSNG